MNIFKGCNGGKLADAGIAHTHCRQANGLDGLKIVQQFEIFATGTIATDGDKFDLFEEIASKQASEHAGPRTLVMCCYIVPGKSSLNIALRNNLRPHNRGGLLQHGVDAEQRLRDAPCNLLE